MIKGLTTTGKYMQVIGGPSSTYVNSFSGAQGIGNLRFNTTNQTLEVYDGNNWTTMNMGIPIIGLTGEAESLLDWARQKRAEEWERERLAESNPTIKDLLSQIKEKEEQIKMVQTLLKSPGNEPESSQELMGS